MSFCVSPQPASLRTCSGSMFGTILCLLQRFAVWWVAPPWPILSEPAVLLALCRIVDFYRSGSASRYPAPESRQKTALLSCASSLVPRTNWRAPGIFRVRQARDNAHSSPACHALGPPPHSLLALFRQPETERPWLCHFGVLSAWLALPFRQSAKPAIVAFSPKLNVNNDLNLKSSSWHAPCYLGKAEEE